MAGASASSALSRSPSILIPSACLPAPTGCRAAADAGWRWRCARPALVRRGVATTHVRREWPSRFSSAGCGSCFLTTHLPSYLALCGIDPMLERQGARPDRRLQRARQPVLRLGRRALEQAGACSGIIYLMRSMILGVYFIWPRHRQHARLCSAHGLHLARCRAAGRGCGRGNVRAALAGDDPGHRLCRAPGRQLCRRLRRRSFYTTRSAPTILPGASRWRSDLSPARWRSPRR